MLNTVRRFLQCESEYDMQDDRAEFWIEHICKNIDDLIKMEEEVIAEHGEDYDRDKLL
jgi:hypothetical protein